MARRLLYKAWLRGPPKGFTDGVEQAALDPSRGYAVRHEARVIRLAWKDPPAGCRNSPVKLRAAGPVWRCAGRVESGP